MKVKIINIVFALIAAIVLVVIFKDCTGPGNDTEAQDVNIYDTVYKVDTVRIESISYVPKYRTVYRTTNTTERVIDTVEVVKEFFEKRVYNDTLRDSLFTVYLVDTIFENKIISRSYSGQILSKTETITKTVYPNPTYISAGAILTSGEKPGISPMLYFTKNKHTVGLGYDVLNKGFTVSYQYKLKVFKNGKKKKS